MKPKYTTKFLGKTFIHKKTDGNGSIIVDKIDLDSWSGDFYLTCRFYKAGILTITNYQLFEHDLLKYFKPAKKKIG